MARHAIYLHHGTCVQHTCSVRSHVPKSGHRSCHEIPAGMIGSWRRATGNHDLKVEGPGGLLGVQTSSYPAASGIGKWPSESGSDCSAPGSAILTGRRLQVEPDYDSDSDSGVRISRRASAIVRPHLTSHHNVGSDLA
jgi:hypothetical protein